LKLGTGMYNATKGVRKTTYQGFVRYTYHCFSTFNNSSLCNHPISVVNKL